MNASRPGPGASLLSTNTPLRGIGLIVLSTILFALSDTLTKYVSRTLPVIEIAWIRYVTFVGLGVLMASRSGVAHLRVRRPLLQVLRGLALVATAILFMAALQRMPMAETAALSFMSPLLITILSIPMLGEQVGPRRWAAVVAGLVGVSMVARPGAVAFQPAALLVVGSSLSWAIAAVLSRKIAGSDRASTTLLWSAATGLVVLTVLLPTQAVWPSPIELTLALLLGTIASTGQYLVILAYRHAAASLLAPFSYLQLIWSTAAGWLVFGAWPDSWTLLGVAVIAVSGLAMAGSERRRGEAAPAPLPRDES